MGKLSTAGRELGKKGGKKLFEKYGRQHFVEMGKRSGKVRRKK